MTDEAKTPEVVICEVPYTVISNKKLDHKKNYYIYYGVVRRLQSGMTSGSSPERYTYGLFENDITIQYEIRQDTVVYEVSRVELIKNYKRKYRKDWAKPPDIQTMDYISLPFSFGDGSSTLKNWIIKNVFKDLDRIYKGISKETGIIKINLSKEKQKLRRFFPIVTFVAGYILCNGVTVARDMKLPNKIFY